MNRSSDSPIYVRKWGETENSICYVGQNGFLPPNVILDFFGKLYVLLLAEARTEKRNDLLRWV